MELAHVTLTHGPVCARMDWLLLLPLFLIPLQGEPAVMHLASETTQSCVSVRLQGLPAANRARDRRKGVSEWNTRHIGCKI